MASSSERKILQTGARRGNLAAPFAFWLKDQGDIMLRLKAILTFTAALAFAAASYSARNFRGYDPAAFPVPVVNPPFQPAPWAFSIWGLIFLALIVQAGLLAAQRLLGHPVAPSLPDDGCCA